MKIVSPDKAHSARRHLEALAATSPASRSCRWPAAGRESTEEVAKKWKIPHWTTDLAESLKQPGVEAVILASPTQMHADQAEQVHARRQACADRDSDGRHARRFRAHRSQVQKETGVIAMARPCAPLQPEPSMGPQAHQGRRAQDPADGRADLFLPPHQHERGGPAAQLDRSSAVASRLPHRRSVPVPDRRDCRRSRMRSQGPLHPELKIAMDMGIQLKVPSGAICTLSLSFNNNGPLGSFFRYICDNGTYHRLLRRSRRRQEQADRPLARSMSR